MSAKPKNVRLDVDVIVRGNVIETVDVPDVENLIETAPQPALPASETEPSNPDRRHPRARSVP